MRVQAVELPAQDNSDWVEAAYKHESVIKFLRSNFVIGEICIRILLLTIWLVLRQTEPFLQVFGLQDQWMDYSYPYSLKPKIPGSMLFAFSIGIPAITGFFCVLLICICARRQMTFRFMFKEFIFFGFSSSLALLLAGSVTNIIKIFIGRPRPDFLNRCFPSKFDGRRIPMIDIMTVIQSSVPICESNSEAVIDGRKSFPSGHSSYFASVCVCSALYIHHVIRFVRIYRAKMATKQGEAKARYMARRINVLEILISPGFDLCVCLGLASLVPAWAAATRIVDRRHHASDVVAGLAIGSLLGYAAFYIYFSRSFSHNGLKCSPLLQAHYPLAPSTKALGVMTANEESSDSFFSPTSAPITAKTL
eukprot:Gregarina_sp_Poly_1__3188@NODE_1905_length_3115_cov_120_482283_g218_i2_p1_GENE_NODE_1905_length_3115_cov_120_482283_g218_i2NODE_1905_length_3115_cov_120_482283_g218_i2_p1_ORF_typecomplete_len363_score18_99PAP2/PF01569_21/8_3e03PAP2/PF01569_21/5_2e26DUF2298/PF10060_9/53DUF2298/PF10060_9/1_2DUF2298/PF10060_9/1_9DUF2407_C/PF13373_6/5_8DUF2407_C/PF13373_6/7_1DUF3566/PF12089_8/0_045DUF624/PF04854_14/1_4e03DUF624/PF04854_14/3_9e02DUF624/PF04854_14/3_9_NODE_1905_length_3115_cov_120_482283_g218_i2194030